LAAAAALGALAPAPAARAQDAAQAPAAQPAEARKVDEYGPLRHCDVTARLDNFAVELQNFPGTKALLVGYDPKGKGQGRAGWYLKVGRYYLINSRGIEPSRVAVVNRVVVLEGKRWPWGAGRLNAWLVPEGARRPDPQAPDEDEPEDEGQP
jgi:hypothetical protein